MIKDNSTKIFVRNVSFLKKISTKSLDNILSVSKIKNLKRDEVVFLEGSIATKFYIILSGTIKLYNETSGGFEYVSQLLSTGDFFGEKSLLGNLKHSTSAEATRSSQVLEIPHNVLKEQMHADIQTSEVILEEILINQNKLESQIEYLSVMNAPQRIGWYVFDNASQKGKFRNKLCLKHDKALIATYLGMKPETFSRSIKKLEKANVFFKGSEITIDDKDLLHKFCTEKISHKDN